MISSFWRPSDEQRHVILFLEALGLIHDLGKLSDTFLKSQEPSSKHEYNHGLLADLRQIEIYRCFMDIGTPAAKRVRAWLDATQKHCAFNERVDLTNILQSIRFTDWSGQVYSLAELTPFLTGLKSNDSQVAWQQVLGKEMQPGLLVGYLHGVAHIEKEGEPQQHKQPYSGVFRASPFGLEERIQTGTAQELTTALYALPLSDIEKITSNQRRDWLEKMKREMIRGLADNRRPHNEVSLWDWGYTVSSMVKSAAVWIFKNGWPDNLDDLPYRTLCINVDHLERYTRCVRISDLLGVSQTLTDAFGRVQALLEEKYALGNCFYHDETGFYYLFPDLYSEDEMTALREEIQAQFPPDLRPKVYLGERVMAGQLDKNKKLVCKLVAELRAQALREPQVRADNNLYLFETEWTDGRPENAGICTVCGVRPISYPLQGSAPVVEQELASWATQEKAEQRNVCRVCLDRRGRRAQAWTEKGLQGTIWIDEVADENGRLALFVGKLGLEGWLDGSLLSTIQVTSSTTKIPSPARLYRIAETARAFWQHVINNLAPTVIGQRPFRLALYPFENCLDLGDYHIYELDVDGSALSVLWDKSRSCLLTVENLAYFAHRLGTSQNELIGKLQGRSFDVLEPSEFGRSGKVLFKVQIKNIHPLDGYQPFIPLLAEPSVCMILIPANRALDMIRSMKYEYEKQMGRVRDRLPISLSLIFFRRNTPIRAVLEAGRAMMNINNNEKWEGWRLIAKNNTTDPCMYELSFDNGITWRIPIYAGDCTSKTVDIWYPRFYEGESWENKCAKHVNELRVRDPRMPLDKGWKIWVQPSRFDFEFLDTTARRFEIYYDETGRRPRRTRPFYLEDFDRLESIWGYMKRLTKSQRHQIIRTIEATRETWYGQDQNGNSIKDPVFYQFVADTLAGVDWPKEEEKSWASIPKEWQKMLIQAGASGELADLVELHMEILKEEE